MRDHERVASPEPASPDASQRRVPGPVTAAPAVLLDLQRQAGNRATASIVLARQAVAAPPAPGEAVTLKWGSRGIKVRVLQGELNAVDEVTTPLEVDGRYGPLTTKAVREFQAAHEGLKTTGAADPATRAALAEAGLEAQDDTAVGKKLFNLGAAAYERGQFAHAGDLFARAHELVPREALLFSRAQALRRQGGRRAEAIALYEEYLASGHESRRKDAEEILAALRGPAATGDEKVDTANAAKAFGAGASLYERGDFAHAYDEMTKAGELADRPGIVFSRAQALRRLGGRSEEAIALYEQYLASGHEVRRKDAESALAELRGPAATGDEKADTDAARKLFQKGVEYFVAGRIPQAYDEFTKAHRLAPRPGLVFSRAQCLRLMGGRAAEAIALYEEYLASDKPARAEEARAYIDLLRSHGAVPV